MTNAMIVFDANEFETMQRVAKAMVASGYFKDAGDVAQAFVKIQAGKEIGLPAFASMTGIHIVQGKPVIGANLLATLIKNSGRYDYRIKHCDDSSCTLTWYEGGEIVGESSFTMKEAQAAGLTGKDVWKKYPSDLLFARAISRGARRYAPGVFGGAPVYTPDELDHNGYSTPPLDEPIIQRPANVTEDGEIVDGEIVEPEPDDAPLPDDELAAYESTGSVGEYINTVAALLSTSEDGVKESLKSLGLKSIPRDPNGRLDIYRQLKATRPAQQAELLHVDNVADPA